MQLLLHTAITVTHHHQLQHLPPLQQQQQALFPHTCCPQHAAQGADVIRSLSG
jgi:hypothetical protein